jgi:hypothetical protein
MNDESTNDTGVHLSPTALVLVIGAALSGGAGVSGVLQPRADQEALKACFDNSQIALNVAAQHGEELTEINRRINVSTQDRWTGDDHLKYARDQERIDNLQDRRLDLIEEHIRGHNHNG